jgi:two-component system sensor histidine kinase YesM
LLSLILSSIYITRSFINPITMVTNAIDKTSEYNFDLVLEEKGGKELQNLIKTFNNMNKKIKSLIRENYEMLILKQQAQLQTMNLQLNPHFLYNILNIVNLQLIKNKQYDCSEMINDLSQMVKYLLKSDDFMENFKTDLEYTTHYINIINRRYKNKYKVVFDIDPELYNYKVPKFFLQPVIENVFVHAFEGIRRKGVLKVTCKIAGDKRVFIVEDNGKGIPPEDLALLNSDSNKSIGISNVRNRIRFIYGDQYCLKIDSEVDVGTTITITLPIS